MPRIIFIADGVRKEIVADAGPSLCQVAVDHFVPGVDATCGGCCACATCHAYVDPVWIGRLPEPTEDERLLLSGLQSIRPESRLLCQLYITEGLDGLIVQIAPAE